MSCILPFICERPGFICLEVAETGGLREERDRNDEVCCVVVCLGFRCVAWQLIHDDIWLSALPTIIE